MLRKQCKLIPRCVNAIHLSRYNRQVSSVSFSRCRSSDNLIGVFAGQIARPALFSTMSSEASDSIISKLQCTYPNSKILVKDREKTEGILQELVAGGYSKLQIVADFDFTLTRYFDEDGKRVQCSWGILDNSSLMPSFYLPETKALLDKYHPIEISATMTPEEKIPHMVEWYKAVNSLLARCKVKKADLDKMVSDGNCQLRLGTEELFSLLSSRKVPVLVFSAGMGDLLNRVLQQNNVNTDNVKIVSNFFKYDEQDCVSGFQGEMIHMFNKNENAIHSSPYFDELKGRNNIILLGDSMGDIQMAKGVPTPNNCLKIGFLNEKIEERLAMYEDAFDIVLVNDQSMHIADTVCRLMK